MASKFINFNIKVSKDEVNKTLRILEQRGNSHKFIDEQRKAMLPGKRISKNGKIYFETRKNRSDKLGSNI